MRVISPFNAIVASVIHQDGYWCPQLAPKQMEVFNSTSVYLLVAGCVLAGKSFAVEHKIVRALWDTPGARIAAFSKTIKAAKHGGAYTDLVELIIPEWIEAGLTGIRPDIKFGYTMEPKVDGTTRTHMFRIRNRYGGESEFLLFSLDCDQDIESRVKQTRFSAFWFIEATNFGDDEGGYKIWRTTSNRLRMVHLAPEAHMWIADCNPSEEGKANWLYQLFYEKSGLDPIEDEWMIKNLNVIDFQISDNPWLTPTQIAKIKSENRSDPALYARNCLGEWVARESAGHFSDVFLGPTHIRGDVSKPSKSDWEIIIPPEGCFELLTGFDPGDVNHAAVIACKRIVGDTYCYDVIDEIVILGRKVSISDFTEAVIERMDFWESMLLEMYNVKEVKWRHWSDSSAFDFNSGIGGSEDKLIYTESLGRIELRGVPKPKGSVKDGVQAVRRLLHENRLFCSAQLVNVIAMFRGLKRGTTTAEYVAPSRHKHSFDALRYLITGEEPAELFSRMQQFRSNRKSSYVGVAA